jgi:hypothetical protein
MVSPPRDTRLGVHGFVLIDRERDSRLPDRHAQPHPAAILGAVYAASVNLASLHSQPLPQ